MKKLILVIALCSLVSGCKAVALIDMHESKTDYKNCLVANPNNINSCDNLKLAYEADVRGLQQTTRALRWGRDDTLTINQNQ
jgi:hypothetical protein